MQILKTNALVLASLFVIFGSHASYAAEQSASEALDDTISVVQDEVALTTLDMESNRGTSGVSNSMTSNQTLESATTGNSLNVGGNMTNGNVSIGENFGGFGSYVMNTGNNSSVNSAVNFNVQIMTAPQ